MSIPQATTDPEYEADQHISMHLQSVLNNLSLERQLVYNAIMLAYAYNELKEEQVDLILSHYGYFHTTPFSTQRSRHINVVRLVHNNKPYTTPTDEEDLVRFGALMGMARTAAKETRSEKKNELKEKGNRKARKGGKGVGDRRAIAEQGLKRVRKLVLGVLGGSEIVEE